jgi:hypothetical protein
MLKNTGKMLVQVKEAGTDTSKVGVTVPWESVECLGRVGVPNLAGNCMLPAALCSLVPETLPASGTPSNRDAELWEHFKPPARSIDTYVHTEWELNAVLGDASVATRSFPVRERGAIMLKNARTHLGAKLRRAATPARQRTEPPAALRKARCFGQRGGPPADEPCMRTPVMIIRCWTNPHLTFQQRDPQLNHQPRAQHRSHALVMILRGWARPSSQSSGGGISGCTPSTDSGQGMAGGGAAAHRGHRVTPGNAPG